MTAGMPSLRIEEGCTLVIAEHRPSWLSALAGRFVYVKVGRVQWKKTPAQMTALTEADRAAYGLRAANALPMPNPPMPPDDGDSAYKSCLRAYR
jgi:energy-coupling factor transporter ATP-binding protein EcfA2